MPAHDEELSLLESRVRAAGKIALTYFCGSYKKWSKEGGSPVTEADLAIDAFLKAELQQARVRTFSTDIQGATCFRLDGKTTSVEVSCDSDR